MRIEAPPLDTAFCETQLRELETLAAQPDDRAARPCRGCTIACPRCGSTGCTCNCSPGCPDAGRRLSSAPDAFPIEGGILPLVYAFAALRLLPTCWSCEGHNDAAGRLRRPPSLWFCSRSLAYPGLVAALLSRLSLGRRLNHDWQVVIMNCGLETDWVFTLEPRAEAQRPFRLDALHEDVQTIAAHLGSGVRDLAADRIETLRRMLSQVAGTPA